jgi:hypothetical protein
MTPPLSRSRSDSDDQALRITGKSKKNLVPVFNSAKLSLDTLVLYGHSTSIGPSLPNLKGPPLNQALVSTKEMGQPRADAANALASRALREMLPITTELTDGSVQPSRNMASQAGFNNAVNEMFEGAQYGKAVAERVLQHFEPLNAGISPLVKPLVVATAVRSMGAGSFELDAILPPDRASPAASPALFRFERMLASTAPGTEALGNLGARGLEPNQLESYRDKLLICGALERKGLNLDGRSSSDDVVNMIEGRTDLRLDRLIGSADDARLQLLSQALLHVHRPGDSNSGSDSQNSINKAAFVAWKKGGFEESGPGTDFNKAIERLHKFSTYVERGDHKPRSFANIGHDTLALLGRQVGVGKSPLTQTRHGTLGGDLGLLHEESAKFSEKMTRTFGLASTLLNAELIHNLTYKHAQLDKVHKSLARAAVVGLCDSGTDPTKIAVKDIVVSAKTLLSENSPRAGYMNEQMLLKHVGDFTKRNLSLFGPRTVKLTLKKLSIVGDDRENPAVRRVGAMGNIEAEFIQTQNDRKLEIAGLVADLRLIKDGGPRSIPLFKSTDVNFRNDKTLRDGPNAENAQNVLIKLAKAKYASIASYSDGRSAGIGTAGAFLLKANKIIGVPLFYPILNRYWNKSAVITAGIAATGGKLFIGTEKSRSVAIGAGAGWAAPVAAAFVGDLSLKSNIVKSEGLAITTRNNLNGWEDALPKVVDYLFEQSKLRRAKGSEGATGSNNASETWRRFAEEFGDNKHIHVGWNKDTSTSRSAEGSVTGVVRTPYPNGMSLGPAFKASITKESGAFRREPSANGADVESAKRSNSIVASASASLGQTNPGALTGGGTQVIAWGPTSPILGRTLQWNIAGGQGEVRLGRTREGELSAALCQREVAFRSPALLTEFINRDKAGWENAMVEQDSTRTTTPEIATARLGKFLQQANDAPRRGDRLYGAQMALKQEVAEQINHIEAQRTTIRGVGDLKASERQPSPAESKACNDIDREVNKLLKDDKSWRHDSLYALEVNQVGSSSGFNFVAKIGNEEQASAVRLTALLIAGKADV